MTQLQEEINKRLTFAIISHPDAGKTTITEKLLLFSGAIHIAGAVKTNKTARQTTSDFMKMEHERGISISTSVMGFDYGSRRINLLDTPGHADFSEDTYRSLSAVDSALILIDSVKGVEERTRRLCEVSRMRSTPIATFINKLDREGRDPFALIDEIEKELAIHICPMTWPVGQGGEFKGVYSLADRQLHLFRPGEDHRTADALQIADINDPLLDKKVGTRLAGKLREDIGLLNAIYPPFKIEEYLSGWMTPVFFGSAINNFGVRELLDAMVTLAPPPTEKIALERTVSPLEEKLTGFIFKIHANLNPKHRDRIAFLRICSGKFERNKLYYHSRTGKSFRSANPTAFMAQNRDIIDTAFAGDIIGLHDTGTFTIGDTITEGESLTYKGIPSFAPQIFKVIRNKDPLKEKQFTKGLNQLAEEGVIQILSKLTNKNTRIIGVVGQLQIEVLQSRLEYEYGASCAYEPVEYNIARWITSADEKALKTFIRLNASKILVDIRGNHILMFDSQWALDRTIRDSPAIKFHVSSESVSGR